MAVDVTPQHHRGGGLDLSCAGRLLQHHAARLDPCAIKGSFKRLVLEPSWVPTQEKPGSLEQRDTTLQMSLSALCSCSLRDEMGSERTCSAQDALGAVTSPFHLYKWGRQHL